MTFLIESLIACALFTLFVFLMSRNPIKGIFNYPPAIIQRCDELGLVDASNKPGGVAFYINWPLSRPDTDRQQVYQTKDPRTSSLPSNGAAVGIAETVFH